MIRSDLVRILAADHPDLPGRVIEEIVTTFFGAITDHLAAGGRVELRSFGAFTTRAREARAGRNPRSGATVDVDGKRVPHFRPGKPLRYRIDAGRGEKA